MAAKAKKKKQLKGKQKEKQEKVQRQKEEVLASAGGFLFMGAYVLITKAIPETIGGWAKFIGLFVAVTAILYAILYIALRGAQRKQSR